MAKQKAKGLDLQKFRISELNPAVYNPRRISDEALKGLTNSLSRFGCVEPICVNIRDGRNVIVDGHQRHKALMKLHGASYEASCVVVDLSKTDEKLLNISLNNPEIQGEFTADLQKQIEQLQAECEGSTALLDLRIEQLRKEIEENNKENTESALPDMPGYLTFVITEEQRQEIEICLSKQKGENRTEQLLCLIRNQ